MISSGSAGARGDRAWAADANAALTDAAHNATLENMLMLFAVTTEEVVNTVRQAR